MKTGVLIKVVKHQSILAMAKQLGYDFALFDNEHGFFSFQELHDFCIYAMSIGLQPIVRISEISKTEICKTLDAGAKGILVPMVESLADVQRISDFALYPPTGVRGYAGGANTGYLRGLTHTQAIEEANQTIKIFVQIETVEGLKHAQEIISHPQLHGVVIGPADLAISMGHPGDYFNPSQLDAMADVAKHCHASNKVFGIIGNKAMQTRFEKDTGFVVSAIDLDLIYAGLKDHMGSDR